MKKNRIHLKRLIYSLLILLTFFVLFFAFQNKIIYKNTLGKISDNYTVEEGNIVSKNIPYLKIKNEDLLNWDAAHYSRIKENGYLITKNEEMFLYAFFPLFSYIWRYTFLSNIGVCILNYFMLSISLIILFSLFENEYNTKKEKNLRFILAFCSPLLVVYLIPYTEATFILTLSIAIYGLVKNKYLLYFIGMFAAAMTRSAITILLLSFIFTTFLYVVKYKNLKFLIFDFLKKIIPAFAGTLAVCIIQLLNGSKKLLIYIDAIKTWNNKLQIPHNITDWSHESFGILIGILCLIIPLMLMYLLFVLAKNLKSKEKIETVKNIDNENFNKEYIFNFSIIYTLGVFLSILLFKGGCMNGIPRYVLCSPFFYILLFHLPKKIENIKTEITLMFFGVLSLIGIFFLGMIPYSTYWNFADTGFFIFILMLFVTVFLQKTPNKIQLIFVVSILILNLIWSSYLFNVFCSDGWIFT